MSTNVKTCSALIPTPGSDCGEEQCERPAGHRGAHKFTQDDQWRTLTIRWVDKPQPPPTPEQLAAQAEFRASYVTPSPLGIQTLLSRAVTDRIRSHTLRWTETPYRAMNPEDVTE